MNEPARPLEAALLALRVTCPPTGVIHIGAGNGRGDVHAWRAWGIEHAVLVEADGARFGWAHDLASRLPGWHAIESVVASADGAATYHAASNPDEDGLVQPESLAPLWPRLRSAGSEKRTTLPLDALLAPLPDAGRLNWLFIDCYGTGEILEGARMAVERADVVVLRSLLDTQDGPLSSSSHAAQAERLRSAGLEGLPFFESTHPLAGHAVFVRPVPLALQARQATLTEKERAARKKAEARAARLDAELASSQSRSEQREQEGKAALDAAHKDLRALRGKLDDADAKLAHARDAQAETERCRHEQATDIAALKAQVESQRAAAAQLASELDAGAARQAKQARELKELRTAGQVRQEEADRLSRQLDECKAHAERTQAELKRKLARMAELENENRQMRHQHGAMQDELVKAEAQIELIKDLLLRDGGL